MSLLITQLKCGEIYRSRISGLPVQVLWVGEEAKKTMPDGRTYGPWPVATVRYYVPGTGKYESDNYVHDNELEPMTP